MTPFECKYQIILATPLVFVDVGEDSVMANDVIMPSNPPIMPIKKEEFEETPFDMNVSHWSHEKKLSRRVVRTQVDCSRWDHRSSPSYML